MKRVFNLVLAVVSILVFSAMALTQDDEYKELDQAVVPCSVNEFEYHSSGDGEVGGSIGTLDCRLATQELTKSVPLATNELVDGGIVTRDFGVFKVMLDGRLSVAFMLTDMQVEQLMTFLAN